MHADILQQTPSSRNDRALIASHTADFTSVNWFGMQFRFRGRQAQIVKLLWEAWKAGLPGLSLGYITEHLDGLEYSRSFRVDHVFRDRVNGGMHPAWGTMIRRVAKGHYALVPPADRK